MISASVTLHGYRYSVYTRIARLALAAKAVPFTEVDVDPFADPAAVIAAGHPFARVPILEHGTLRVYETAAITTYIDAAFDGPPLMPQAPSAQARAAQVIAVVDSYGYRPMVRQVFAHAVFRPALGLGGDPQEIADGLAASAPVLAALNDLAQTGEVLTGPLTRADIHLAPMMAAFTVHQAAAEQLTHHKALWAWWQQIARHPALIASDPGLPSP
ncbi:MAG: glutathione S-transferase family protein [Pseudomonadota bacterium]